MTLTLGLITMAQFSKEIMSSANQRINHYPVDKTSVDDRGGRKGSPKTAKRHRNTPKNRKLHPIFS